MKAGSSPLCDSKEVYFHLLCFQERCFLFLVFFLSDCNMIIFIMIKLISLFKEINNLATYILVTTYCLRYFLANPSLNRFARD